VDECKALEDGRTPAGPPLGAGSLLSHPGRLFIYIPPLCRPDIGGGGGKKGGSADVSIHNTTSVNGRCFEDLSVALPCSARRTERAGPGGGASIEAAPRQGLTLVHFSAQPEPCLSLKPPTIHPMYLTKFSAVELKSTRLRLCTTAASARGGTACASGEGLRV